MGRMAEPANVAWARSDKEVDAGIRVLWQHVDRALSAARELPQLLKEPVKNKERIEQLRYELKRSLAYVRGQIGATVERMNDETSRLASHIDNEDLKQLKMLADALAKVNESAGLGMTLGSARMEPGEAAEYFNEIRNFRLNRKGYLGDEEVALKYIKIGTFFSGARELFEKGLFDPQRTRSYRELMGEALVRWDVSVDELMRGSALYMRMDGADNAYASHNMLTIRNEKKGTILCFEPGSGNIVEMKHADFMKKYKPLAVVRLDGIEVLDKEKEAIDRFGLACASDNPEMRNAAQAMARRGEEKIEAAGDAKKLGSMGYWERDAHTRMVVAEGAGEMGKKAVEMLPAIWKSIKEDPMSLIPGYDLAKALGDGAAYLAYGEDMGMSGKEVGAGIGIGVASALFDFLTMGVGGKVIGVSGKTSLAALAASVKYSVKAMGEKTFRELVDMGFEVGYRSLVKSFAGKFTAEQIKGMTFRQLVREMDGVAAEGFLKGVLKQTEASGLSYAQRVQARGTLLAEMKALGLRGLTPEFERGFVMGAI